MPGEPRYKFEEFELDGAAQTLRRNGEDLALRPQLFAVLRLLVEHPNETVTKDQFFDSIWQGDHSAAASLNTAIKELRKLLGDEPKDARFIRTKAGWGYQFVAPVTVIQPSPPREEPPSQPSAKAAPGSQAAVPSGRPKRRILWFMAAAGVAALTTIAGLATWPRSAEVEEVGWWRPQTAANGIVEDRTGHGNTGKVTGHLRQTEGRHGPAGYFDGSTYITGTTPGNNFPEGADPFAIAMWIRTTVQDPNSRHLFHFGDRLRLPARNSTYLAMYKGGLSVFGFGLTYDEAGGHTRINDGRWHHLVGLYEGRGSSLMMLYLDGEENGRAIAREPANLQLKIPWTIGVQIWGGNPFEGAIDDVRLMKGRLTHPELAALYRCGLPDSDVTLPGGGKSYYLPIARQTIYAPERPAKPPVPFEYRGFGKGGIQFAIAKDDCALDSLRGADLPHDLYVGLDLRLPAGSEAGPYFRAVGVAPGGVIEGRGLPGYSVRLGHSGAVSVHSLNHPDNADPDPVARSVPRAGFDANEWHRLEGEIRGSTLRVWLDGEPVLFGMDNARAREVPVAAAKAGSAAGIATVAPEQPVSSIEFRNVTVRKARPQL